MLKATFLYQIKLSYGKVGVVQLISLKQNNRVSDKIVRKMINVLCQQTSSEEKNLKGNNLFVSALVSDILEYRLSEV